MKNHALRFVVMIGIVSFFADFVYEGARSVTGPFLAVLGASGVLVGFIAGLGELLGYGLRLVSGSLSERTGEFWPITLFGYVVQMCAVPLLAWAPNWQVAGLLIVCERIGKAIRNPPRDVMLSHAAKQIGLGFGFGLHEALDQAGALVGPLVVAFVIARHGDYRSAFAHLLIPAILTVLLIFTARFLYPKPEDMEVKDTTIHAAGLPRAFWIYLAGAAFVAAGFADFSLIAFHFEKNVDRSQLLGSDFLFDCDGGERPRVAGFRALVRSRGNLDSDPAHARVGGIGAHGFSRRILAGPLRIGSVGAGNGSPRIDHPGGGRNHGSTTAARFRLRDIHLGIWSGLVCGQRGNRKALRRIDHRLDHLLRDRPTRRDPNLHRGAEASRGNGLVFMHRFSADAVSKTPS